MEAYDIRDKKRLCQTWKKVFQNVGWIYLNELTVIVSNGEACLHHLQLVGVLKAQRLKWAYGKRKYYWFCWYLIMLSSKMVLTVVPEFPEILALYCNKVV